MSICENEEELLEGCKKARDSSDSGNILIERYITGEESWHFYFLAENEVRQVYCGRAFKQPGYPSFLYLFAASAVNDLKEYKEQVDEKCIAFLKDIGCKKGISWFQFIKDGKGRFYALEMAQRMSADCSGKLIKKAFGVNIIECMLDIAFGKNTLLIWCRNLQNRHIRTHPASIIISRKGTEISLLYRAMIIWIQIDFR